MVLRRCCWQHSTARSNCIVMRRPGVAQIHLSRLHPPPPPLVARKPRQSQDCDVSYYCPWAENHARLFGNSDWRCRAARRPRDAECHAAPVGDDRPTARRGAALARGRVRFGCVHSRGVGLAVVGSGQRAGDEVAGEGAGEAPVSKQRGRRRARIRARELPRTPGRPSQHMAGRWLRNPSMARVGIALDRGPCRSGGTGRPRRGATARLAVSSRVCVGRPPRVRGIKHPRPQARARTSAPSGLAGRRPREQH